MEALFAAFMFAVFFMAVCGAVANSKGRNVAGWCIAGFFFGVLALIFILCLPKTSVKEEEEFLRRQRLMNITNR